MRGNIDERGRKLFIGGLHLKTTEESLKAFYSQWGDLIDVVVMKDPHTGRSRGFGFVTYNDPTSVDAAQSNRPHEIDGIKVDAKRAMPKEDTSPEFHATVNRLFVGRLKKTLTTEDLKEYFSEFGTVSDAVIINSPTGESRGFGFVTFDDPDSVDKIIVSRPHEIDGQVVEVKKALPKEDNRGSTKPNTSVGNKTTTPRGGFNKASFNPRFQETPNNSSFDEYPSSNGNYRSAYNANNSAPYSQNYSAPNRQINNPTYNEPFDAGYNSQPAYNRQPSYSQPQYNSQPQYSSQPSFGTQPQFSNQQQFGNQPQYSNQPPYKSENPYLSEAPYKNESSYSEPDYGYGQFSTPSAQPSRPQYGYPPNNASMGDFNKKPAGGPMRGSSGGFARGRGARFGTNPY